MYPALPSFKSSSETVVQIIIIHVSIYSGTNGSIDNRQFPVSSVIDLPKPGKYSRIKGSFTGGERIYLFLFYVAIYDDPFFLKICAK